MGLKWKERRKVMEDRGKGEQSIDPKGERTHQLRKGLQKQ